MSLSDIVSVNISTNTVVPSRVGFGTPLIFDYHTRFAELARTYTSLAGMAADGFLTTDAAYRMAQAILSQNPKVRQIIVGRMTTAPSKSVRFTPIVFNNRVYEITVRTPNGDATVTYTSDGTATAAEITLGLVTALNANATINSTITAVDNVGTFDINTDVAGTAWYHEVDRTELTQDDLTADPGSVANLTAIGVYNDDWYTVHPTWHSSLGVVSLAAYVETLKKLMVTESADDDNLAGTGLGADLKTSAYARTALMYYAKPVQYPGAAWAGKLLPQDPGSATWKFKTLAGVAADDGFTATQLGFMRGDNVNFYNEIAGVNITEEGYSASGEFIDVTQGVDWLAQRLQERIFGVLANAQKVPFTDPGIQMIENEVRAQLQEGIGVGFLAADPEPVVTVPLAADVSTLDKANRLLPDVEFSATLAGAIHAVEINGSITV